MHCSYWARVARVTDGPGLASVEARVCAYIREGGDFLDVLNAVVSYQRRWNSSLDRFWAGRGFEGMALSAAEVPAVPTDVFRDVKLCSSERAAARVFRTSGTMSGKRGEHWKLSTAAYDEGAVAHFRACVCGEMQFESFLCLVDDPTKRSDSSLSHMVGLLAEACSRETARYFVGDEGVDVAGFVESVCASDGPVVVFATAFSLAHVLAEAAPMSLPTGSIVVETGGFKGRHRELSEAQFYGAICDGLGIDVSQLWSEYSMTELSSQLYARANCGGRGLFRAPDWCLVQACDPSSLQVLPYGERGLLRFVDLANTDSVVAVQTSDVGVVTEEGVRLSGRAPGAVPRGCSLAAEEILSGSRRADGES